LSVLLVVVTNITAKYSSWKWSLKLYLSIRHAFPFILKIRRIKVWYRSSTCPFRILYGGELHWGHRVVFNLTPIQYRSNMFGPQHSFRYGSSWLTPTFPKVVLRGITHILMCRKVRF
jgi:hypothetical protein